MIKNFITAFIIYLAVINPVGTALLTEPAAITLGMVVANKPAGNLEFVIGYGAMVAVMLATAIVLIIATLLNPISTCGSRWSFRRSRQSFWQDCRFNILLTGFRRLA